MTENKRDQEQEAHKKALATHTEVNYSDIAFWMEIERKGNPFFRRKRYRKPTEKQSAYYYSRQKDIYRSTRRGEGWEGTVRWLLKAPRISSWGETMRVYKGDERSHSRPGRDVGYSSPERSANNPKYHHAEAPRIDMNQALPIDKPPEKEDDYYNSQAKSQYGVSYKDKNTTPGETLNPGTQSLGYHHSYSDVDGYKTRPTHYMIWNNPKMFNGEWFWRLDGILRMTGVPEYALYKGTIINEIRRLRQRNLANWQSHLYISTEGVRQLVDKHRSHYIVNKEKRFANMQEKYKLIEDIGWWMFSIYRKHLLKYKQSIGANRRVETDREYKGILNWEGRTKKLGRNWRVILKDPNNDIDNPKKPQKEPQKCGRKRAPKTRNQKEGQTNNKKKLKEIEAIFNDLGDIDTELIQLTKQYLQDKSNQHFIRF